MNEKNMNAAMEIILHAGDARMANLEAIRAIEKNDIKLVDSKLKEAEIEITLAHKSQTDQIQNETRGNKSEYSLLFAHAQDTLMTINSEIILTKGFQKIFYAYDQRIKYLEKEIEKIKER